MDNEMFINLLKTHDIVLTEKQVNQFAVYYELLVEWNKKVNLTAITEKGDVYLKHFYDSISPAFYFPFKKGMSICDIGAGAGFPSIPIQIVYPDVHIIIVDSLKKRIAFLEELKESLHLENIDFIHGRAEDIGQHMEYREGFDVVTARAVARMAVLAEYCLPLCKIGGSFLALKGANASDEAKEAEKAIKLLGGKKVDQYTFHLPEEASERSIYNIKKVTKTPKRYPRKAGVPAKAPI